MADPAPPEAPQRVILIGEQRAVLRDAYHAFLTMRWSASVGLIALGFGGLNLVFALIYLEIGGIANARPGSLLDMLYFSVQTSATIGYGAMAPTTDLANAVVMIEATASLIVTALATGLVFAKFSRTTARVRFSDVAVVTPVDGVDTLVIRIGNERGNIIVGAQVRLVLSRLERTREGERYYRFHDLRLTRDFAPALSRSWTVMHVLDDTSPLRGFDAAQFTEWDAELILSVSGVDDTTMQPLHAIRSYETAHLRWGVKFATMISSQDGALVVDLGKFHEVEASTALPR
ncbi:MAG: ion channel [Kofleriaceae bacterium]